MRQMQEILLRRKLQGLQRGFFRMRSSGRVSAAVRFLKSEPAAHGIEGPGYADIRHQNAWHNFIIIEKKGKRS